MALKCVHMKFLRSCSDDKNSYCSSLHLFYPTNSISDGIACPDPPFVANSKQRYEEGSNGVFISYVCNFAHHFPDKTTVKQVECLMDEGRWSKTLPDCEG